MSQRGRFLLTSSVRNGSQLEPSLLTSSDFSDAGLVYIPAIFLNMDRLGGMLIDKLLNTANQVF